MPALVNVAASLSLGAGLAFVLRRSPSLRDETLSYARRLRESGVVVQDHVVAGPTGWPNALGFWEQSFDRLEAYLHELSAAEEAWTTAVRDHFIAFFAQTMPVQRSAAFRPSPN